MLAFKKYNQGGCAVEHLVELAFSKNVLNSKPLLGSFFLFIHVSSGLHGFSLSALASSYS